MQEGVSSLLCCLFIIAVAISPINNKDKAGTFTYPILIIMVSICILFIPITMCLGTIRYLRIFENKMKENALKNYEKNYIVPIMQGNVRNCKEIDERLKIQAKLYSGRVGNKNNFEVFAAIASLLMVILQIILSYPQLPNFLENLFNVAK